MKWIHVLITVFALAALARAEEVMKADPARIVVDPDAYIGKPVTVAVKFLRIEKDRERWEKQSNLNSSTVIKFRVSRLREVNCYATRTQRNTAALAGLTKGTKLVLAGAVKKYRTKVVTEYEAAEKGHRRVREVVRTVRGHVRYAFLVDSIARAE